MGEPIITYDPILWSVGVAVFALALMLRMLKLLRILEQERERMLSALRHALEWLDEEGCDCGTDEPGTCALCEAKAVLERDAW